MGLVDLYGINVGINFAIHGWHGLSIGLSMVILSLYTSPNMNHIEVIFSKPTNVAGIPEY